MVRVCANCGVRFEVESSEFWKRLCLDCWLKKKVEETDSTRRASSNPWIKHTHQNVVQENAILRRQLLWLRDDIDELELENGRLRRQLSEIAARLDRAGSLEDEFHENLPRLIQLTHPDKHGGSLAAQRATQWLLSVRRSAPALVEEETS